MPYRSVCMIQTELTIACCRAPGGGSCCHGSGDAWEWGLGAVGDWGWDRDWWAWGLQLRGFFKLQKPVQEVQAGMKLLQQPEVQGAADQPDAIASMSRHICTEFGHQSLQSHAIVSNIQSCVLISLHSGHQCICIGSMELRICILHTCTSIEGTLASSCRLMCFQCIMMMQIWRHLHMRFRLEVARAV